jgi:acyl-[acyl-carrier-protein]-phospholipid O-acyltransferase/long-chain-fatty-acid--[acyl-carrier-protein] ligase
LVGTGSRWHHWIDNFVSRWPTGFLLGPTIQRLNDSTNPVVIRFLNWLVRKLYGYRICNAEVLKCPGPVLLLPNHSSWWDWLLIGVCLEKDWRFAVSREAAEVSWIHKRIMINSRTFPVDMNSPYGVKHMAEYLLKGGRLVLFPEGRLSRTGSLMKLFDGTGFLIYKTHAKVITAYLRNAYRLPFSPNPSYKSSFPRLSVHFSNILTPPQTQHTSVTEARHKLTDWLRDQMVKQQFETEMEFGPISLPAAILESALRHPRKIILQDVTMKKLTYLKLLTGANVLAAQWRKVGRGLPTAPRIGVLLPNVTAMPVVLLSLWFAKKVPAILNYTVGPAILFACVRVAELKQIITSKKFIENLKLDLKPFQDAGIEILFLEDVRAGISWVQKLVVALFSEAPEFIGAEDSAVILFTSGSEGDPKAVELTHRNVLANIRQMVSVIDLMESDRFFNALPLFHSFGLTIGLILPLVRSTFVFLYLSPLHYRVVPSAFYNLDCTVMFGTNTFLNGYARKAHPYDFRSLRYMFAGAEKLQENTANVWLRKFGVRILEGYGATECSPCVSANTPMRSRHGSAGQLLPDIDYKFEPVEGVSDAKNDGNSTPSGRLFVRGPNVMRGYLNPDANAKFQALGGWYDTGDIVNIDADGYVHILGRLKRFAKVSGEMISLTAVEDVLSGAFSKFGLKFAIAVVAKPDEGKGEKLIAATNESRLTMDEVRTAIRGRGLSNLAVPREIKVVQDIPRLGTGKINHRELEKLV